MYFGPRNDWAPFPFAISGDSTQHLLYRLLSGGLPPAARWRPRLVSLLIGTNNLGNPLPAKEVAAHQGQRMSVNATIAGIGAVVALVRERLPRSRVLLQAILPRTDKGYRLGEQMDPSKWEPEIMATNDALRKMADGVGVHFIDCGGVFLGANHAAQWSIDRSLMADGLHPSLHPGRGHLELAMCMQPALEALMALPLLATTTVAANTTSSSQ
eukprot:SAG31_NODE_3891_length_3775_cov_4.787813_2_plen_213_part_00